MQDGIYIVISTTNNQSLGRFKILDGSIVAIEGEFLKEVLNVGPLDFVMRKRILNDLNNGYYKTIKQDQKAALEKSISHIKNLKKNKVQLTDDERSEVMKAKAVWHHGSNGEETPAIWKSVINGKTYYCCNTHRIYAAKPTLKGAIKAYFDYVKESA